MGAGNTAQLGDTAQPGEGDEFFDVDLVGAAGLGIGEIGEPFEFGRDVGEVAELGRGERARRSTATRSLAIVRPHFLAALFRDSYQESRDENKCS
jgi:hypothetical protein